MYRSKSANVCFVLITCSNFWGSIAKKKQLLHYMYRLHSFRVYNLIVNALICTTDRQVPGYNVPFKYRLSITQSTCVLNRKKMLSAAVCSVGFGSMSSDSIYFVRHFITRLSGGGPKGSRFVACHSYASSRARCFDSSQSNLPKET